jgi:integrase
MRGIYRRGSIYWLARQVDKKRHFVSLETSDPVEALSRAEQIRSEGVLESGTILCHTVERYIRYCRERGEWTLSTERSKGYVLKNFAKWVGKITPGEVSPEIIHRYYTERLKTHSPRTAHGNLMTLRGLFRWCMEVERTCRDNPAAKVRVKTPSLAAREDFCSPALRDKLISECPREDLKFVLYCGFHAGLRFSEIVEARASWFDLNAGLLHLRKHEGIQFKDGEERTIPLTKGFSAFLKTYGLHEPYMVHPEIPTRRRSVYRWDFGRPFDLYIEAQQVPWVTPHIMRHTFASLLASAGVSIYKIAKWLGDDVRTVQRHYAKLLPNDSEIERAFSLAAARKAASPSTQTRFQQARQSS